MHMQVDETGSQEQAGRVDRPRWRLAQRGIRTERPDSTVLDVECPAGNEAVGKNQRRVDESKARNWDTPAEFVLLSDAINQQLRKRFGTGAWRSANW